MPTLWSVPLESNSELTAPPPRAEHRPGLAGPADRPVPRDRFHRLPAALVAGYLIVAAVVAVAALTAATGLTDPLPADGWLLLHMVLLGAATNAIFAWSLHFAFALLRTRSTSARGLWLRLAVLNAGVLTVLAGVAAHAGRVVVALGAVAVTVAVLAHLGALVGLLRGRSAGPGAGLLVALRGPLAGTLWFYVAAGVALVGGVAAGALLVAGLPAGPHWPQRLHAAHGHLNTLGWLGLSIIGTEFALWPMVLGTRVSARVPRVARRVLATTSTGLAVAVLGMLAGWWPVAAAGLVGYAVGVLLSLDPFTRVLARRGPHDGPGWLLGAAMLWLLVALALDLSRLFADRDVAVLAGGLGRLVPALAFGFTAQTLLGALTFLLPVVLGGGPAGSRRLRAMLDRGWPVRLVLLNAGTLLLTLPVGDPLRAGAGTMVGIALAWVAVLVGRVLVDRLLVGRGSVAGGAERGQPRG